MKNNTTQRRIQILCGVFLYSTHSYAEVDQASSMQQLAPMVLQATSSDLTDLKTVAGATQKIDAQDFIQGRSATSADIFVAQAGIYAKSSGNEGTKISIRGSGINRATGAHASGLYVLLDDIPFTGPGGTPYELLEPLWLDHVEVYRGANGLDQGALALGGAINYWSKTGKNAPKLQLRYETGSHGWQKYALSSGQQQDAWDYYLSLQSTQYQGHQRHASGASQGIMANVGYQIHPHFDTRFYLRYRQTEHQTPGRLTQQHIHTDPEAANPQSLLYDAQRIQPGSTWLANQTRLQFDDGAMLQASVAYHHYPIDIQESLYRTSVEYADVTASLRYSQPYLLWGKDAVGKIILRSTTHRPDSGVKETLRFAHQGYAAGELTRKYSYRGSDNVLLLQQDVALPHQFWFTSSLASGYVRRESEVFYPATGGKRREQAWYWAPRIGLRFDANDDQHWYANLSRSVEPAHPWSMIWGSDQYFPEGSGAATGRQRAPIHLDAQQAWSVELGGAGESAWGNWQASVYRSVLQDELLSVQIASEPEVLIAESNASDTVHQGIELALHTPFATDWLGAKVALQQSYNYSDFRYQNDAVFAKNRLPGIPKHYYQAQLKWTWPMGVYSAITHEYASKIAVDYANTRDSKAYQVWGWALGYQAPSEKWQAWLDVKNLANRRYAAVVIPAYNDNGKDAARFSPAEGLSAYAGIALNF